MDQRLAEAERRLGRALPQDLRKHYLAGDWSRSGPLNVMAPEEVRPVAELQVNDSTDDYCPREWVAVVDMDDGNYIAVDLRPTPSGHFEWLDCDHDNIGDAAVIAHSVDELIERSALTDGGTYWLERGFQPYRRVRYENPPSFFRRIHGDWYRSLGHESGPGGCIVRGCSRLQIAHSACCRRHHYEQVRRRPCPFDD